MIPNQILEIIAAETSILGYRKDAIRRDYAYSDVWLASGGTRTVPFVAFTQTPPSYRSAAFAVTEGGQESAQKIVESHRALGAPLFFVIENDFVSSWQIYAHKAPRLLDRFGVDLLAEKFHTHSQEWAPDAIHRAKSIGRVDTSYQLDFVDVGLIPAIEGEIHTKLDRLIREAVANVRNLTNSAAMRLLFRGVFRLLAAKILTDRQNARAEIWNADDVADVLSSMGEYYSLGKDKQIWPERTLASLKPVWAAFRSGFNVANISADDLAYVYESTLVTPQARAQFGTHSTPRHVADYILDRFRLWEFGANPPRVYEPFAGAGVFLGSALRQMRDGLPHDWTDKQRHDLLVQHIGGAEIDPFACEVAKLSLILADYPNANGWQVEERDLFAKGTLAARLKDQDVILCNPPYEAFTADERAKYPEAWAIDGSKAVFALATALGAKPKMLGFVVPNTLLVDRRYREQRRAVERVYREVELVSLPDGVFNVSQLDTALLIARDTREPGATQTIRSSAVYDADKKRFAADRSSSHTITQEREPGETENGDLWLPPLQHVWTALSALPTLRSLVRGHWGLRWHDGQKEVARIFNAPGPHRVLGFMHSDALHQFVLAEPRFLDARPQAVFGGLNYDWDAPKILANAGRLSRGYWRLAAAVDRGGRRASQQFIAFWPSEQRDIDLDAVAALLNGPVINAFLAEHSFDKRFRIGTLEGAPVPKHIPSSLGEMSRAYAAAALRTNAEPEYLASLLSKIDTVILDAYELSDSLKRDLFAAIGTGERPLIGMSSRRRPKKLHKDQIPTALPLFSGLTLEEDAGDSLGRVLSPSEAEKQLQDIAKDLPVDQWAGRTLTAAGLHRAAAIRQADLAEWQSRGLIVGFRDGRGKYRYPLEQFTKGTPAPGLNEIVTAIGDPRVAWLWLRQPHLMLNRRAPIEILREHGPRTLWSLVARDFR